MTSLQYSIPPTPRVISPSPTPSEQSQRDGYFAPETRSKSARTSSVEPIKEHVDDDSAYEDDPDLARARSRSRSPQVERRLTRQTNGTTLTSAKAGIPPVTTSKPTRQKKLEEPLKPPKSTAHAGRDTNGFLSPASAYPHEGFGSAYWRSLSRSPSPFGLIPIHREWRAFIHKHEIPRKFLHVSIGFVTLYLYHIGYQVDDIHPVLLSLLIPIGATDVLRFRFSSFNAFYIHWLGAFMRESEAHDRYNGVISYLAGLWFTMRFCSKDIAVMSVLLLSWCDTAASTFGRLWGRYTPRIRRGKSLAGSLACFVFGIGTAVLFWGIVAPYECSRMYGGIDPGFAFHNKLTLPPAASRALGWTEAQSTIEGSLAMGILALASGFIASASELVDLWGLDDNLLIPFFCGLGLAAFLWGFGGT